MRKINNKKILLIQESIPAYRVEIYNKLSEYVNLTILHSSESIPENINFNTIYVPYKKIRYKVHKKNLYAIAQKYDVVISMLDFTFIYNRLLYLLPHKYKLIFWGIGVSASYNERYDKKSELVYKLLKPLKKADAGLFYCDYPKRKYASLGIPDEKLFVANNTVPVEQIVPCEKNSILFIGSLYKQKKIFELLDNYLAAYKENHNVCPLVIIGSGDEYDNIVSWIKDNSLESKIKLTGAIFDEKILCKYFTSAIMCISPDQAGLSVLKSMGYGVPFVTHKDAITGGERFNIQHNINGILFNEFNDIKDIILDSCVLRDKYLKMGIEAKNYYDNNRTVDIMVSGFLDAIKYTLNK